MTLNGSIQPSIEQELSHLLNVFCTVFSTANTAVVRDIMQIIVLTNSCQLKCITFLYRKNCIDDWFHIYLEQKL